MAKSAKKYVAHKARPDGTIPYTDEENEVWSLLINRQLEVIKNRASDEFISGLEELNFSKDTIPQPAEVTKVLKRCTGWSVEPVEAVIPADDFFALLANKKFPAASFIRTKEELDYLQEPDIFHEYFGHCPLLTCPEYADFVQAYGELALKATKQQRKYLFRVFWFTIEFGLIKTNKGNRIYGGGILSSFEETKYALSKNNSEIIDFSVNRALRTPFRIDIIQPIYFIISHLDDMYKILTPQFMQEVQLAIEQGDIEAKVIPQKDGIDVKYTN